MDFDDPIVEATPVGAATERHGEQRGKLMLPSSLIALYFRREMELIDGKWVRKGGTKS
jgi:hypothetical protein